MKNLLSRMPNDNLKVRFINTYLYSNYSIP